MDRSLSSQQTISIVRLPWLQPCFACQHQNFGSFVTPQTPMSLLSKICRIKQLAMAAKPCTDCRMKCGKGKIPEDVLTELDKMMETLENSESKSLLKKHLTRQVFTALRDVETPMKSTLMDCIQSGVKNPNSSMGIYAGDADCYVVYKELFDPIICDYHNIKTGELKHPKSNWGSHLDLQNIDQDCKYIISTRIRTGRSVEGYPFSPRITEQQLIELEQKVSLALNSLEGDLKGTYYSLKSMNKTEQQKLIDDHFLFKEPDPFMRTANIGRYWPKGRGIFYNPSKTFLVWLLEEDHLRIISMEKGGNIRDIYKRLSDGVSALSKLIKFARNDKLGFLTCCPSNLGTSVRASVLIKLPNIGSEKEKLEEIAKDYNLQVRGASGENTEAEDGAYDISNKRRLGLTEFEAVKEMSDGIQAMIKLEESASSA